MSWQFLTASLMDGSNVKSPSGLAERSSAPCAYLLERDLITWGVRGCTNKTDDYYYYYYYYYYIYI